MSYVCSNKGKYNNKLCKLRESIGVVCLVVDLEAPVRVS